MSLVDTLGRPLRSLRVSVTDRCNLRCQYCMPEAEYVWLPREDILTFEEIAALVDVFTESGVDRVRVTGGEPLLRRDLPGLIAMLASRPRIADLALTTNGVLLCQQARALKDAGLHRITVSVDTLDPDRFRALTRVDSHHAVLEGLRAAADAGFASVKIDTVVMRGVNDDELIALLDLGRAHGAEVRFIEYMDVGGATRWSMDRVVTRDQMLEALRSHYGGIDAIEERSSAPAERFRLPDGTTFGIIASTTAPFCGSCDRSRLTADGLWFLCLYARQGTDLRRALRAGARREELAALVDAVWRERVDRGAEQRLDAHGRTAFIPVNALRADAHLEMHTRGG